MSKRRKKLRRQVTALEQQSTLPIVAARTDGTVTVTNPEGQVVELETLPTFYVSRFYRNRAGEKTLLVDVLDDLVITYCYRKKAFKFLDRWGNAVQAGDKAFELIGEWPKLQAAVIDDNTGFPDVPIPGAEKKKKRERLELAPAA